MPLVFHGAHDNPPPLDAPYTGAIYYDREFGEMMVCVEEYASWVSMSTFSVIVGRNGTTHPGQFYRFRDGALMTVQFGVPVRQGLLTRLAITQRGGREEGVWTEVLVNGEVVVQFEGGSDDRAVSHPFTFKAGILTVKNAGDVPTHSGHVLIEWKLRKPLA